MKKKKLIATVLSASMLVGLLAGCGSSTDPAESPTGGGETTPAQGETTPAQNDVDYANFVIDPAQIPQESWTPPCTWPSLSAVWRTRTSPRSTRA